MPRKDIRPNAEARVVQVLADCSGDKEAALLALALQVEAALTATSAGMLRLPPSD